jgi:hypothetical protein
MKHCAYAVERYSDARTTAFADLCPKLHQELLDVRPADTGPHWIGEDRLKRPLVLVHLWIVSYDDITRKHSATRRGRKQTVDQSLCQTYVR